MGRKAVNPNHKDLMDIIMYLVPQLRWINLLYKVAFNYLISDNSSQFIEPYFTHKNSISFDIGSITECIQHIFIKCFQYITR